MLSVNLLKGIRKFAGLRPADRKVFLETVNVLVRVRLSLTFSTYDATLRLSERLVGDKKARSDIAQAIDEPTILALRRASRVVPRATCLAQAIAGKTLLARRGHRSTLRFGVAKKGEDFEAHAWLESDGKVIVGDFENRRYAPLG